MMATKSKTPKTSAAKRATPKAAMKQAPREPKREVSGICGLIARWHFLEAEEVYRAEISAFAITSGSSTRFAASCGACPRGRLSWPEG
jgi:hypothetical protein